MTRSELEALCRPRLDTLWPDIRIPGLPVWHSDYEDRWTTTMGRNGRDPAVIANVGVLSGDCGRWHLDLLASPIGADVLARRVAVFCGWNGVHPPRFRWMGDIWDLLGPGFEVFFSHDEAIIKRRRIIPQRPGILVPALAQLDPTCDERVDWGKLDWGKLGSARLVDLAALALVAQHLTTEDQE